MKIEWFISKRVLPESVKPGWCRRCGFTLIELVAVIVIIGILASVAVHRLSPVMENARTEDTKREMKLLAFALAGNQELQNGGVRADFGYIGDVGAMPPDFDALVSNPGSFSTWKGPYIESRLARDDYKKDGWNHDYVLEGATIISTGSGDTLIHELAGSISALLSNRVTGVVFDADGTPPGEVFCDSLLIRLDYPDGTGGSTFSSSASGTDGSFGFDSIPIGNHQLEIIYLPEDDTNRLFVTVLPGSMAYREYYLAADLWRSAGSGLIKVAGSDSLVPDCHGFFFWIENTSVEPITIDSVKLSWSAPVAYYRTISWDDVIVFDEVNPKAGSAEWADFTSSQVIGVGERLKVVFNFFKNSPTGGANVDMDNTTFQLELSDGTILTVMTGACP